MDQHSETGDCLQFLIGGCLFGSGGFLLANQVMVRSSWSHTGGGLFGGGFALPWGTPGMGLLMIPLGIGVCMLFAGRYRRWANVLVWASLAALLVGVLNSVRITFRPTTLWQNAMPKLGEEKDRRKTQQAWRTTRPARRKLNPSEPEEQKNTSK